MNSKYSQAEMQRLKHILYPQQPRRKAAIAEDLDETHESKLPESNKENYCDGNSRGCVTPSLKAEMSRLKGEVEEMLRSDEQLDSVLNSTTRFYLERIRQLSAELPEEIACLEEACNGLINSIPPSRPQFKVVASEHIEVKVFVREVDRVLLRVRHRLLSSALISIAEVKRECVDRRRTYEIHRLLTLSHGFHRWRRNIVEEEMRQKQETNQQGLESLTGLLDHFLSEGQLIVQLTNLVREEADFAEVLIYEKETCRLYTYLDSYSNITNSELESVSTFGRLHTTESEQSELKRYEVDLEDSLTRMCICRKEVLRLDRIEQDRDYSTCDAMINQQLESFRPLSLGAIFMPLLNPAKEVVGVLRLYYLDRLNATIDVRIAEFLGGIVEAAKHLSSKLKHISLYKRQEKTQLFCKLLPLLKIIQEVTTAGELFERLFQSLRSIFFFDEATLLRQEGNTLKKVFSTSGADLTDKKHLLHCLKVMQERNEPLVQIDNAKVLRVGSCIHVQGLLEVVQPRADLPVPAMDMLLRYVFNKSMELDLRSQQQKEQLRIREMRMLVEKREHNKQLTRNCGLKLLECESFEQLSTKFEEFVKALNYSIVSAQLFLKYHGQYVSYHPAKTDKVKSRSESHSFVRRLTKNKRLVLAESDQIYEEVLNYNFRNEDTSFAGLALLNIPIEVSQLAGYFASVAVPQGSIQLDHLTQDLQQFIRYVKGVSKPVARTSSKNQLTDLAIFEYHSTIKSCPVEAAEGVLRVATGKECRILEFLYDRLLFRDEPVDLPQDFFQQTFKQGITEMPRAAGLSLVAEDPELLSELERIQLSQLKHCRQEFLTLSRVFGRKVDRLVSAYMAFEGKVYVVLLEGPTNYELLDLYEQLRETLSNCVSRSRSLQKQKLTLSKSVRNQKFAASMHYLHAKHLQTSFNTITSGTKPPPKIVSLSIIEQIQRQRLQNAFSLLVCHCLDERAERLYEYNFTSLNALSEAVQKIRHRNCSVFFSNIQKNRQQIAKVQRGMRLLCGFMAAKQSGLLMDGFHYLSDFRRVYQWPQIFDHLVVNRLLFAMSSIKLANRVTCDNRESFVNCLVFEPQFSSLGKIFQRVAEISQFTFYLENRSNGKRVSWNPEQGLRFTNTASQLLEVRFEAKHWTVLWTYPHKELLDLEFKQYLGIVAKAITDNLNNIRRQSSPLVKLLNSLANASQRNLKAGAMCRWRSELLKDSKKLEYSIIEKAYRMNQELSMLTEMRQKKRTQLRRKQEELELARSHIEKTEQLIAYEKQEIAKMERMINGSDFLYRLKEIMGGRARLRNCWLKWRAEARPTQSRTTHFSARLQQQLKALKAAGVSTFHRLFRNVLRSRKHEAFKRLAVNFVKSRQLEKSRNSSPIKHSDYISLVEECQVFDQSHLLVEQFDGDSKLTTFSKIEPIVVPRNTPSPPPASNPTASKRLKFISENVPPSRLSPAPATAQVTTPARLSTSLMGNVRERMIMHNSQLDAGKLTPLAYKLSNQTMRFLKKFGRDSTPSRANQSDFN